MIGLEDPLAHSGFSGRVAYTISSSSVVTQDHQKASMICEDHLQE
jgi:hypothetical protein